MYFVDFSTKTCQKYAINMHRLAERRYYPLLLSEQNNANATVRNSVPGIGFY